jgi:hypothetical protein
MVRDRSELIGDHCDVMFLPLVWPAGLCEPSWPALTSLELPPSARDEDGDTFDSRWAAWQARGRVREARMRARAQVVLAGVVFVAAIALLWMVIVG